MALPTLEKTWSAYRVSHIYKSTILETNKQFLIDFKNLFKTMGWTVSGSGNGTTGAMDGSDRWSTTSDISFGATTRSWVVLKNTGLGGGNFQVLFDLQTSTTYQYDIYVSPGGNYTGGGTSKPTASDELLIYADGTFGLSNSVDCTRGIQAYKSSDNKHTRVLVTLNNTHPYLLMFETPGSARTSWTNPWYVYFFQPDAATYIGTGESAITVINGVTTYLTLTCTHNNAYGLHESGYFNNGPGPGGICIFPSLLVSRYGDNRGVMGRTVDLWSVPDVLYAGRYFHSSGTKVLTNYGNFVMPCAGEVFRVE